MKTKIFALVIALVMALSLAACNGGDSNTPSGGDTATPSPTPSQGGSEPTGTQDPTTTPDGNGRDTGEPYNGYGVYEFGVYRYEGEWQNGKPNGSGTVYYNNPSDGSSSALTGSFQNGLSHGSMTRNTSENNGNIVNTYVFDANAGEVAQDEVFSSNDSSRALYKPDVMGMEPWARNGQADHIVTVSDLISTILPETTPTPDMPPTPDELNLVESAYSISGSISGDTLTIVIHDENLRPSYAVENYGAISIDYTVSKTYKVGNDTYEATVFALYGVNELNPILNMETDMGLHFSSDDKFSMLNIDYDYSAKKITVTLKVNEGHTDPFNAAGLYRLRVINRYGELSGYFNISSN